MNEKPTIEELEKLLDDNNTAVRILPNGEVRTFNFDEMEVLETKIKHLEAVAFKAYCSGYESGHHDTVETNYTPPSDYPEEWPDILKELLEDKQ